MHDAPRSHAPWRRLGRDLVALTAFCLVLISARWSLASHYVVPTPSMVPAVQVDDHVLVDATAYGLRLPFTDVRVTEGQLPARGDVVVLRSPEDGTTLLKRVVAVPGDVVEVRDGRVYVDGERSEGDAEVASLARGGGPSLHPKRVPAARYLVMGDNRGVSHDGRSFGLVDRDAIFGRVLRVFVRDGAPTWVAP